MTDATENHEPRQPQIWVDADACPAAVRDILFRAAERAHVHVTLVANQWLRTPPSYSATRAWRPRNASARQDGPAMRRAQLAPARPSMLAAR
jgi:uncharacterized protein YaiI (UPF0178 family)